MGYQPGEPPTGGAWRSTTWESAARKHSLSNGSSAITEMVARPKFIFKGGLWTMRARIIFGLSCIWHQIHSTAEIRNSQATTQRLIVRAAILTMLTAICVPWAFGQQLPLAGKGSGGAIGPSIVTFGDLPSISESNAQQNPRSPKPQTNAQVIRNVQPAPLQIRSHDTSHTQGRSRHHLQIKSAFSTYVEVDVAGATDGSHILASDGNGTLTIYDLSGNIIKQILKTDFWCGGSTALPVCSSGGFDVDQRVVYDVGAKRWTMTALWLFGSNAVATDVIAVSQTSDPKLGWNLYQFPACGSFDNWDTSDQPHTGFSDQWIVLNSFCTAKNGIAGAGLAVFSKRDLYNGKSLMQNVNWFEFTDPFDGRSDNPVRTYGSKFGKRQYFTHADTDRSGFATITYSYLTGLVDQPIFFSSAETVTTGFQAAPPPGFEIPVVDAPGCSNCIVSFSNSWIHSSGLFGSKPKGIWILSSLVMGDPHYLNATQVINVATDISTHRSVALRLTDNQDGAGPMASEIAMSLKRSGSGGEALVVYDDSENNFYPGLKAVLWNLEKNTIIDEATLQEGSLTPTVFPQGRWVDFIDAIAPIPGTSRLVVAGSLASPSAIDPQHATYWAQVSP